METHVVGRSGRKAYRHFASTLAMAGNVSCQKSRNGATLTTALPMRPVRPTGIHCSCSSLCIMQLSILGLDLEHSNTDSKSASVGFQSSRVEQLKDPWLSGSRVIVRLRTQKQTLQAAMVDLTQQSLRNCIPFRIATQMQSTVEQRWLDQLCHSLLSAVTGGE